MSFIYPRTIAITRPVENLAVGIQPYSGVQQATETPVVSGIPASVQAASGSARPRGGDLPASPPAPIQWNVFIPRGKVANGIIQDRDVVTDDLGDRYQVSAAYWNSMGWKLLTIRLEAH